jgi:hypothetical protein
MHALPPHIESLIDQGHIARASADEAWLFILELTEATERGEITLEQGLILAAMVGARQADGTQGESAWKN